MGLIGVFLCQHTSNRVREAEESDTWRSFTLEPGHGRIVVHMMCVGLGVCCAENMTISHDDETHDDGIHLVQFVLIGVQVI